MKKTALPLAALVIAGCAAPPPRTPEVYPVHAAFDAEQAREMIGPGTASIKGNAFLRQRGGGVVTCAGETVTLVPATKYARERFWRLFGVETDSGFHTGKRISFSPDPPEYAEFTRSGRCDSQGNFVFESLRGGEYYVTTRVVWEAAGRQGGNLFHRIRLQDGQKLSVILSE